VLSVFAGRQRHVILLLVTTALGLSVVDRAAFSIAGPLLVRELGIGTIELGWLFSAFTWSYVLAQLPSGWMVDRLGARLTVLGALCLWAVCSVTMAGAAWFAHAFAVLAVLRTLMGALQAPIGPAAGSSIAAWFPSAERGMAGALFASSNYLALALITPVLGWMASRCGWQSMFLLLALLVALLGMAWWLRFELPRRHRRVTPAELAHIAGGGGAINMDMRAPSAPSATLSNLRWMLTQRMVAGILLAQYGMSAVTWFFISWFPIYLVQGRGMSLAGAGAAAALPGLCGFAGGLLTGLFSDRLLRRSGSLSRARKLPIYLGTGLMVLSFGTCPFAGNNVLVVALLSAAMFGKGLASLGWTLVADVFPPRMLGLAGGAFNSAANVSGIITTVVTGYLIAATGSFDAALWLMAVHAGIAFASCACLVRRVEPIGGEAPVRVAART
jgi:sugar phosphate permease